MWNIEHHGETPKRSLSDEKIENDDDNIRTSSFALTDRAYSLRETKMKRMKRQQIPQIIAEII